MNPNSQEGTWGHAAAAVSEPSGLGSGSQATCCHSPTFAFFNIHRNGTVDGHNGTLLGDVFNEGIVSPGESPGKLSIDGDFIQGSEGRLIIEIAGPAPATQYDVLEVRGTASLDGILELRLLDGFVPQDGMSFACLTAAALNGSFADVIAPVFANNRTLTLNFGPGGISAAVTPVPLPAAVWMMGGGLVALFGRRGAALAHCAGLGG